MAVGFLFFVSAVSPKGPRYLPRSYPQNLTPSSLYIMLFPCTLVLCTINHPHHSSHHSSHQSSHQSSHHHPINHPSRHHDAWMPLSTAGLPGLWLALDKVARRRTSVQGQPYRLDSASRSLTPAGLLRVQVSISTRSRARQSHASVQAPPLLIHSCRSCHRPQPDHLRPRSTLYMASQKSSPLRTGWSRIGWASNSSKFSHCCCPPTPPPKLQATLTIGTHT